MPSVGHLLRHSPPVAEAALPQRCAEMARVCADDTAAALRSARVAADVAPVFAQAQRVTGLRLKPTKSKAMVIAHGAPDEQAQLLRERFGAGAPEWREFFAQRSEMLLGMPLGRAEAETACWGPLAKWLGRVGDMVVLGMPVVAASTRDLSRVLAALLYKGGMCHAPRIFARLDRAALCRHLRLPDSAMPIQGRHDLRELGGPTLPDAEVACATELAIRTRDTEPQRRQLYSITGHGTEAMRPLQIMLAGTPRTRSSDSSRAAERSRTAPRHATGHKGGCQGAPRRCDGHVEADRGGGVGGARADLGAKGGDAARHEVAGGRWFRAQTAAGRDDTESDAGACAAPLATVGGHLAPRATQLEVHIAPHARLHAR